MHGWITQRFRKGDSRPERNGNQKNRKSPDFFLHQEGMNRRKQGQGRGNRKCPAWKGRAETDAWGNHEVCKVFPIRKENKAAQKTGTGSVRLATVLTTSPSGIEAEILFKSDFFTEKIAADSPTRRGTAWDYLRNKTNIA